MSISLYDKEREYKDRVSKKFMVILNYYFEDYFDQNPEEASTLGLKRYDHKIKDYSDEAYAKEIELNKDTKKKLRMVNPYNLSIDEHADFLLLQSRCDRAIFDYENHIDYRTNQPQLYLPTNGIYCLLFRTMKDSDRLRNIALRLNQVPRLIEQAKTNLKNPPRLWTETTISHLKAVKHFFAELSNVEIINNAAKANPGLGNELVEANKICLAALEDYDRFLNVDLIERSAGEFCIGRQAFDFYLSNDHFLEYTSGYLNELGYELFSKTLSDIKVLSLRIDKKKSHEAVISELEAQYAPPEKLMNTYSQLVKRTKAFVIDNDLISFPKEEEVNIIETPDYFRDIIPFAAYYTLGPYEESSIGQFWVTPVTENDPENQRQLLMDGHNLYRLPSVVLHETYPGHHLQFMIAKEALFKDNISTIRRATVSNLFCEGWALYCEQMMGELGYYSDQQKLLMLKQRLWRATRVILDTELHTGRRSYEEAVAFMVAKLNMSEKFARAEVTRYTMNPTQPLTYELGRRLINQIRDKEKIRLREDFSLKQFHDKLLSKGTLPIKIIAELVFNQKVEVLK